MISPRRIPVPKLSNEILEQIKRLDKTVNDLLFFGKPTIPEPSSVDVNIILKKTIMFASQHRGGKNVEKRLELDEELPAVYVDPKQVQQVFLNLILNALQAMREGGVLTISSTLLDKGGP